MSVNQPSLSKYIKTLMSDVYNSQPVSVHHFLDRTKSQQAYNAGVEQVISSLDFRIVSNQQIIVKYLSSPQVDDVLLSYLVLLLANNYCGHQLTSKLPKRESVINHLLKTAEQNFSELQDDNSIEFLRKLYHELFDACEKSYGADVYSDNISIGNIPHSVAEHTARDKHFNTLILRVNAAFNEEYIAFDAAFEATKAEYMKVLRSAYQTGFIYLLGEHKFSEFYVPPVICNSDESPLLQHYLYQHTDKISTQRNSWKYIFSNSNIIYVIGGAGYGKSLFLKNIVNNYAQLSFRNSSQYLVIYCDIKTFYTNGDNGKKTIADFLQESMINLTGAENISKDMILYYMKRGRCIILFDALDEVPKEMRLNLHKKLVTYFSGQNQSNKVCITSRARGFIPQSNIDVKEILPLFEKDIEEYIDKMICLKKFNKTEKSRFLRQAKVLNDKDFLNSFLILSLLVNIYKSEKALPENKIELYKKCFEYIAKKREIENAKAGFNWDLISPIMKDSTFISLAVMAAPNNRDIDRSEIEQRLLTQYKKKYADEATAEKAINEFLEFCSNRTELFVLAAADDKYRFFHRSFFEYFYARYIYQQTDIVEMYKLMEAFDIDSEVFELSVALVKDDQEEKYQALVNHIFNEAVNGLSDDRPNTTAFSMLTLSMQVVDDAYFISQYFELVIKYRHILVNSRSHLNHKLIANWLIKEMERSPGRREQFRGAYRGYCIQYVLDAFYRAGSYIYYSEYRWPVTNRLMINKNDIPFFMCQFANSDDLYVFMESVMGNPASSLLASMNLKLSRQDKRELTKGYNNYEKMPSEIKVRLLKYLTPRGYES